MATTYTYYFSSDFTNATQAYRPYLEAQINADATIGQDLSYAQNFKGDRFEVTFASALSSGEKAALDAIIAAYTYSDPPLFGVSSTAQVVISSDTNNPGDFTNFMAAAADARAFTSFYFTRGFHYITSDIYLPDGAQLKGELPGKTVLIMTGPYSIYCDGSGGLKKTDGTISITHLTDQVVGVGTSFLTNLNAGDYILLGTNYYEIKSCDTDTTLTLDKIYVGRTLTNVSYVAQAMYSVVTITALTIIGNPAAHALDIRAVRHSNLKAIGILGGLDNCKLTDCGDLSVGELILTYAAQHGLHIDGLISLSSHTINTFNAVGNGIEMTGNCENLIFESCASENNNGIAFNVGANCHTINILDSVIKNVHGQGIVQASGASGLMISDSEVAFCNGPAVELNGNNNNVNSNVIQNNDGVAIQLGGDATIVTGNQIINNGGDAIKILSGAEYNEVQGNIFNNNTGKGVHCLADKNSVDGNTIISSGDDAIYFDSNTVSCLGNNIYNSSAYGIYVTATSSCLLINNNSIHNCTNQAIYNLASSVDIHGNCLKNSTTDALYNEANMVSIQHNHIQDGSGKGIVLAATVTKTHVSMNRVMNQTGTGIEIPSGTDKILCLYNICQNNGTNLDHTVGTNSIDVGNLVT